MAYSKLPIGKATMFTEKGNWKGSHRHFKSLLASSTSYSLPHPMPHNQTCCVENKKCLCFLPKILFLLEQNKQCIILLGSPQNMRLYRFSCLSATCCNVNFRGQSVQVNSREPLLDWQALEENEQLQYIVNISIQYTRYTWTAFVQAVPSLSSSD